VREPIIIEGEPFDWEGAPRRAELHGGGNTIRGAMMSDPGCMACPGCFEHLWKEGTRVRCPHCGYVWEVANPGPLTVRALKKKIEGIEARGPRTPAGKRSTEEDLREAQAELEAATRGVVVLHVKEPSERNSGPHIRKCTECGVRLWLATDGIWTEDKKRWESPPEGYVNCRTQKGTV